MRLSFYTADPAYCDFLREADRCVPYTYDAKQRRPFVGILIEINGCRFYAPLSSPKPKHLHMKNQIDFLKINQGTWGVINFNNMIPIHGNSLTEVNLAGLTGGSKAEIDYKNLLENQLTWCNSNKDKIRHKAEVLYKNIADGRANKQLVNRCCKFQVDEVQYQQYCKLKGWFQEDKILKRESLDALKESIGQQRVRNAGEELQQPSHELKKDDLVR